MVELRGYIKELLTLARAMVLPGHQHSAKFVILGIPRSGSQLLVELLDSHPGIGCESEILTHKCYAPRAYYRRRASLSKADAYGFKLLVDHFETQGIENPNRFMADMVEEGYRIINLRRLNLYRASLSSLYASYIGKFHHKQSEGLLTRPRMVVDPEKLVAKMERFIHLEGLQKASIGNLPHLEVTYEQNLEHQQNHQAVVDRISDYLALPRAIVSTDQVKVTTENVSDFVANSDEICTFLKNSKYSQYLES
jgi:hypothetical protein